MSASAPGHAVGAPQARAAAGACGVAPVADVLRRLRLRLARQQASPRTLALLVLAGCCVCVLSLRGRGAAAAPGGGRLGADVHLPSLPVFVINGPEDYAARKWVEQQLASVGVTRYERINGVVVEADDCMRLSGEGCQQGLALAHLSAWRRIVARQLPVALVVEDDVTWHRDFATLLPRYLAQAPSVRGPCSLGLLLTQPAHLLSSRRVSCCTRPELASPLARSAAP